MAKKTRDQTFWKVLNAALDLDFRKGHLKWTMSELSRKSGITRSLIYYHFGRSKLTLLQEAVRVIGEQVIGVGPERIEQWRNGDWKGALMQTRELMASSSNFLNFYLLHRERPTEIGESLRGLEGEYMKKLKTLFPQLDQTAHTALYAFLFGVAFAPNVDEAAVDFALSTLKRLVRKKAA